MFKSIRWKFVTIYFILVLIAMLTAGIFITREIDDLHVSDASKELESVRLFFMPKLQDMSNLEKNKDDIDQIIDEYKRINFGINEEVWVIDSLTTKVVSSTSVSSNFLEEDRYINMLLEALRAQEKQESIFQDDDNERNMVQIYPITSFGENTGLLLLRRDLTSVDETVSKIESIIVQVIFFSSLATIVLGFIISKSISDPIKALTQKAVLMSKGNFDHHVEVQSHDEIGELSETFNFLTRRLKKSLNDISLEKTKVEAIVNHMADGVIAVDNSGQIIMMNPKAIELLHFGTDGYFETYFDTLIEPISDKLTFDYITKTNDDWSGMILIDIEDTIIKFSYAPYIDDQNKKNGVVYVLQDVTDSEKLDIMRREFVANVSHELKTPLTSIKSYTETLLDGYVDDPETQKEFLTVIDNEAERMARLVKDLLQLSNFDAQKVTFFKEYDDYLDLVRKSIKQLSMSASKKSIKISLVTERESLVGHFDLHRMEQVMINILSNAIKYTPEHGKIFVQITEDDKKAIVRVRDTGIGIPADDLNHIFDRFYRVDKARTRNMGGTGLGLSIAQEIVQGHDGTIEMISEVDKGTTVIITLPL